MAYKKNKQVRKKMTTAKEKLLKIKDKLKRNAIKAGIMVTSMTTLTAFSPKLEQSENKEKIEQVSEHGQYTQKTHQEQIAKYKQMIAEGKNLNEYLDEAINWDNLEGAEILLKGGADPNLTEKNIIDSNGKTYDMSLNQTPVFFANSLEMVKLLEKYGADLNHKDKYGHQPLFFLSMAMTEFGWDEKTASYLLEKGNSLDNLKQFTPTDAKKIKFCLDLGIKRDMPELLMQSLEFGDVDAIRYILEHGGKKYINTLYTDEHGLTDLPIANASRGSISENSKEKIKLLIENGADINKECSFGSALRSAEKETVAFLKQCTAEYTAKMQKMTMSKER